MGNYIGCWSEYFARQFARVVAVEASEPLYDALNERCASYLNVKPVRGDVLCFEPQDRYELVFLGGLLMYLNEADVVALLRKLVPCLEPGGMIVCRETTVRSGVVTREGNYQAVYRSVAAYTRIFNECGLSVVKAKRNTPYVVLQMGCEFVEKWKDLVPERLQMIPVVGRLVYWASRTGYPWIVRVPGTLGWAYPKLTNHFFVLRPSARVPRSNRADSAGR